LSEKVIVRQNKNFEVDFWAVDPNQPDSEDYQPVHGLHEITPYGMMLVSIATCNAQVVLSYAGNHGYKLDEVEFHMRYERTYQEDCDNCDQISKYEEEIYKQVKFIGDLNKSDQQKLFKISHQCPIDRIFKQGIEIQTELDLE
jgi:uncharacterized OsmC-like protein